MVDFREDKEMGGGTEEGEEEEMDQEEEREEDREEEDEEEEGEKEETTRSLHLLRAFVLSCSPTTPIPTPWRSQAQQEETSKQQFWEVRDQGCQPGPGTSGFGDWYDIL